MTVKRFHRGESRRSALGASRLNVLVDQINRNSVTLGDDLIIFEGGTLRLNIEKLLERIPKAGSIRLAKAQANAAASATLSVKLLDPAGDVIGDAFNVANIQAAHWHDLFPLISNGDNLFVVHCDGAWYGMGFAEVGACA